VVFGKAGGFAASLDLSTLDGSNGFQINGEAAADRSGYSVSAAGDVNGDGFGDLIIGARYAGASYVVFGSAEWRRNPNTISIVEPDGDVVKISLIGAAISAGDIALANDGSIESIDLTRFAEGAAHAKYPLDLIIGVSPASGGKSDGVAHVGFINAEGLDLGNVTIKGGLGSIVVGDNLANRPALHSLKCRQSRHDRCHRRVARHGNPRCGGHDQYPRRCESRLDQRHWPRRRAAHPRQSAGHRHFHHQCARLGAFTLDG
jgi:hypothetical protein